MQPADGAPGVSLCGGSLRSTLQARLQQDGTAVPAAAEQGPAQAVLPHAVFRQGLGFRGLGCTALAKDGVGRYSWTQLGRCRHRSASCCGHAWRGCHSPESGLLTLPCLCRGPLKERSSTERGLPPLCHSSCHPAPVAAFCLRLQVLDKVCCSSRRRTSRSLQLFHPCAPSITGFWLQVMGSLLFTSLPPCAPVLDSMKAVGGRLQVRGLILFTSLPPGATVVI